VQPVTQGITVYQGDTFDFFFRVRNRVYDVATSAYIAGTYVDLTGWTGKAQIRANADAAVVLAEFSVTISNQITTPGGVLLVLTPALTAALPATGGFWDVELTNAVAEVRTFIAGAVTVTKQITRV